MRYTTRSQSFWWSAAGIEPATISFLWSEAVAAEVVVFFLIGPALVGRLGARGAAVLAAAAGIVRWSVAGVTTSVLTLSIVQPLHPTTSSIAAKPLAESMIISCRMDHLNPAKAA